jgi:hypothetical protein
MMIKKKKKEITYPAITQGKKGQPITVKNILFGSDILLKITARYEDWIKLRDHIPKRKEHFPWDFGGSFICIALENSKERLSQPEIGIYGTKFDYHKKKNNQSFIDDMQIQAALLYKHRLSKSRKNKREDLIDDIACDLQKVFSRYIRGYKVKPFFNKDGEMQENFYLKYIYQGLQKLKTKTRVALDRVYNLSLLINYVEMYDNVEPESKELLKLMRSLADEFVESRAAVGRSESE